MEKHFDLCLIDFFPQKWLAKPHRNATVWNAIDNPPQETSISEGIPLGHGIAVLDIVQKIYPEAIICLIPVTSNTTIHQINNILSQIIINKTARTINISFGFYMDRNEAAIKEMNTLCECALKSDISIVCAKSNDGSKAFPADCNSVVAVWGNPDLCNDITFLPNSAMLRYISIYVNWYNRKKIWVHGNSFFAPIISSLISRYGDPRMNVEIADEFLNFKHILRNMKYTYDIIDS